MRPLLVLLVLALTAPAASAGIQDPPTMPDSTKNEKRCKNVELNGYGFRVWVVRGGVPCKAARRVVRKGIDAKGWTYFDWTKGGNGPWSDVWDRSGPHRTIGAIINA